MYLPKLRRGHRAPAPPLRPPATLRELTRILLQHDEEFAFTCTEVEVHTGPGGAKVARTKQKALKLRGLLGSTSEITPYLFVGGSASAQDEAALVERGVTHIINATVNEPNAFPERFEYLRVAVPDVESTDIARHFGKAVGFVGEARAAGGGTLVHCSAGMSVRPLPASPPPPPSSSRCVSAA